MAKKRPTLDAFLNSQSSDARASAVAEELVQPKRSLAKEKATSVKTKSTEQPLLTTDVETATQKPAGRHDVIRHMLYLPLPVYDQLQALVFEEQRGRSKRRKTHDYLLDAIDLLFKEKGLKSIEEITVKGK